MKDKTLLGVVLGFFIILGIGVSEQIYLDSLVGDIIDDISRAEEQSFLGNLEESSEVLQKAIKKWDNAENVLGIIIDHGEIQKISYALTEIDSKLKKEWDSDNVSANFALVKEYIKNIKEGNEFTTNNVL